MKRLCTILLLSCLVSMLSASVTNKPAFSEPKGMEPPGDLVSKTQVKMDSVINITENFAFTVNSDHYVFTRKEFIAPAMGEFYLNREAFLRLEADKIEKLSAYTKTKLFIWNCSFKMC